MKKSCKPINIGIAQLAQLLKSGDLESAQTLATSIYQQSTAVRAPSAPPFSGLTVDPALVARTNQFLRHKAACKIAKTFYNHAELDLAKQWAETCDFTVNDQYTRRARVLLADIATAMDKDDDAIALYTGIINEKNQRREQPAAYAGLLELLQLSHQDDQIEPWVRHGQNKFRKAGGLQQRFLWAASRVLRRRNHPLWREINAQIVALTGDSAKWKLKAQRELASNARKFGKHDEAETHYAAICAQPIKSTVDTVNMHLFLAESQAKQGKDYAATLQQLSNKAALFRKQEQKDYAAYRTAKFYQSHGREDVAASQFSALAFGFTGTTWAAAALNQLAKLAEKSGDLHRAAELYLQYPQKFPQDSRLVMQAYAGALNAAEKLGDDAAKDQILGEITSRSAAIDDYNVHLNLAWHYKIKRQRELAKQFIQSGLALAQQALDRTSDPDARVKIHLHVLRRLSDSGNPSDALEYIDSHKDDFAVASDKVRTDKYGCYFFWIRCYWQTHQYDKAVALSKEVLPHVEGDSQLEAMFMQNLGYVYQQSGDQSGAREMYQWVAENYPAHPWANPCRIRLAEEKFNNGSVHAALELADQIISTTSQNAKMGWIRTMFLEATYLRGRCLIELGQSQEGQRLVDEALAAEPRLGIKAVLRKASGFYEDVTNSEILDSGFHPNDDVLFCLCPVAV